MPNGARSVKSPWTARASSSNARPSFAGFAIATRTVAGWAFAFWTFANLMPRAVAYRKWYRDKFGAAFPKRRRAMIPFAW